MKKKYLLRRIPTLNTETENRELIELEEIPEPEICPYCDKGYIGIGVPNARVENCPRCNPEGLAALKTVGES